MTPPNPFREICELLTEFPNGELKISRFDERTIRVAFSTPFGEDKLIAQYQIIDHKFEMAKIGSLMTFGSTIVKIKEDLEPYSDISPIPPPPHNER